MDTLHPELERVYAEQALANEDNDCAVLAVALATGVSYQRARQALADAGREPREAGTEAHIVGALHSLGWRCGFIPEFRERAPTLCSVGKLLPRLVRGRFIVICEDHAAAAIDRRVVDPHADKPFPTRRLWIIEPDDGLSASTSPVGQIRRRVEARDVAA
jgi:hypothetical protein